MDLTTQAHTTNAKARTMYLVPSADEKVLVLYTKIITTFLLCILLLLIITMSVLDLCNSVHTLTLSPMFSGKISITMAQWSHILPSLI